MKTNDLPDVWTMIHEVTGVERQTMIDAVSQRLAANGINEQSSYQDLRRALRYFEPLAMAAGASGADGGLAAKIESCEILICLHTVQFMLGIEPGIGSGRMLPADG